MNRYCVALLILAAVASAGVTIKTGPGSRGGAGQYTLRWNVEGATDGGYVVAPPSAIFVVDTNTIARTYASAGLPYRVIRLSVVLNASYLAANKHCTFGITLDGGSIESWSAVEAGNLGSPVCEFSSLSSGELDGAGDVCTRSDSTGTLVPEGSYWQVISNDRSGATDCEVVTGVGFEVTVDLD